MRRRQSSTPQGPDAEPTYPIVVGASLPPPPSVPPPTAPTEVIVTSVVSNNPPPLTSVVSTSASNGAHATRKSLVENEDYPPSAFEASAPQQPPAHKPIVIQPPLPPQHVYAPMPALGALSIGFLSRKKAKKEDDDFKLITNGNKWPV